MSPQLQRVLTSPLLIVPTIVIAVGVAFLANLFRKNPHAYTLKQFGDSVREAEKERAK